MNQSTKWSAFSLIGAAVARPSSSCYAGRDTTPLRTLGGAQPGGAEPEGAEPEGVEPRGAESEGAESGGAEPQGTASSGGPTGASRRLSPQPEPLSPQQLREGFTQCTRLRSAAAGGARAGGARAGGTGAGGAGAGGAGAVDPGARGAGAGGAGGTGAGGAVRPRPRSRRYSQPPRCLLLLLTLSRPAALKSVVSLNLVLPRRVPRPGPPPFPGTHAMALRPSSVPLRVPLPAPPESSLLAVPDPESDSARAANPTLSCLLATIVTDPSFESTDASALVAELVDFAAACRLDYATALVAEFDSTSPPSIGGECALSTDVLEDRQEDFECLVAVVPRFSSMLLAPEGDLDAPDIPTLRSYAEAITCPYSSQWQAAMDAEMASWKVKRPPGSPPAFKARYVARGFSQRQGVDYFQTFSPNSKMTTLRMLLHVAAQRDYELPLDFSTAFLQGSLHEEIWLRRPPGFTGTTLAALGFAPSTAHPSLFLSTDTSLSPFYVLVYVDDLVFATANTETLTLVKSEL
ncbi:unnamed protein product [Closterium sp. NIES-53]